MPIDSLCSGCGKTLRVNDEFVGRRARCPICGFVYVVSGEAGIEPTQSHLASDSGTSETIYATEKDPVLQPLANAWEAFAPEESATKESSNQAAQPLANPITEIETPKTREIPNQSFNPVAKFLVRTPNSMVYGPADTKTILDWINQGRLDDTCHIREQNSEQWLGLSAWRFQSRQLQNPIASPIHPFSNQFGAAPLSSVQSVGAIKTGNGMVVLVLGIVSWVLCVTGLGAWICSVIAIILALVELGKIREGQSPRNEKAIVLIGMWLGITNLLAWVFSIFALIIISILNA